MNRSAQPIVFAAMPFGPSALYDLVFNTITAAAHHAEMHATRVDREVDRDQIWMRVERMMREADLIVADFSPTCDVCHVPNANVVTEATYARYKLDRRVIIVTSGSYAELPFDWRGYAAIAYRQDFEGLRTLSTALEREFLRFALHHARGAVPGAGFRRTRAAATEADTTAELVEPYAGHHCVATPPGKRNDIGTSRVTVAPPGSPAIVEIVSPGSIPSVLRGSPGGLGATRGITASGVFNGGPGRLTGTLRPGDRVTHPTYGPGTVLKVKGSGDTATVKVDFEIQGKRSLAIKFSNLRRA